MSSLHTKVIHEDNVHHFNEIILVLLFELMMPFLFVDAIIMPLHSVSSNLSLRIISIVLLHKLELLAKRGTQEAHKSNVNLLQLIKTNYTHI